MRCAGWYVCARFSLALVQQLFKQMKNSPTTARMAKAKQMLPSTRPRVLHVWQVFILYYESCMKTVSEKKWPKYLQGVLACGNAEIKPALIFKMDLAVKHLGAKMPMADFRVIVSFLSTAGNGARSTPFTRHLPFGVCSIPCSGIGNMFWANC